MPQLLLPGNPIAIGIETSAIIYIAQQYGFSGQTPKAGPIFLAGLGSAIYHYMYYGMPAPPTGAKWADLQTNLASQNSATPMAFAPQISKGMVGTNQPYSSMSIPWASALASPVTMGVENCIFGILVEYQANSLAAADILFIGGLTYVYNTYIQTYIAPYLQDVMNYF